MDDRTYPCKSILMSIIWGIRCSKKRYCLIFTRLNRANEKEEDCLFLSLIIIKIGFPYSVFRECLYVEEDVLYKMIALEDDCLMLDIFTPMGQDFVK